MKPGTITALPANIRVNFYTIGNMTA